MEATRSAWKVAEVYIVNFNTMILAYLPMIIKANKSCSLGMTKNLGCGILVRASARYYGMLRWSNVLTNMDIDYECRNNFDVKYIVP